MILPPGRGRLATKTGADRIRDHHEHDRDGVGLCCSAVGTEWCSEDHVGLQLDQLFCECPHPTELPAAHR